jgi:hypothetical protein
MFLVDNLSIFLQQIKSLSRFLGILLDRFFDHIRDQLSPMFFYVVIHAKWWLYDAANLLTSQTYQVS